MNWRAGFRRLAGVVAVLVALASFPTALGLVKSVYESRARQGVALRVFNESKQAGRSDPIEDYENAVRIAVQAKRGSILAWTVPCLLLVFALTFGSLEALAAIVAWIVLGFRRPAG